MGLNFNLNNSSNVITSYADIYSQIVTNTAGSEDGKLIFSVADSGTLTTKMTVKSNTINMPNLPTSATGLSSGDIYNDSGTLKIV